MAWFFRAFLVVLALGVAGGNPALSASASVAISVHAEIIDDVLHIQGNATVPNGAWIIYAAYRVAEPQRRVTGYAEVKAEQFAAQAYVSGWPPGEIAVDAHFQMRLPEREQPAAIIALFGRNGELMRGDNVVQGGGAFRAAIASTKVTKRR
jgi:hypothetical protein